MQCKYQDHEVCVRKSCDQIIIFSPVFNGGYASHLKNTLDWLSLAFDEYKYNDLFKLKSFR